MAEKKNIKNRILRVAIVAFALVLAGLGLGGCAKKTDSYQYTGFAMGTAINVTIYTTGGDISRDIESHLLDVENNYISWKVKGSDIDRINEKAHNEPVEVSDKTAEYLGKVLEISKASDGALDPTIGRISRLWDFDNGAKSVPPADSIDSLLTAVGYDNVQIAGNMVSLQEDSGIDLGAVGKGIGCDEVRSMLEADEDIQASIVTVGASSVLTYGSKPDGSPWTIGIQDPRDSEGLMALLEIEGSKFVGTSGDYEKFFIEDGKRYCHILDPDTGYPAESGLIATTIVGDNGLECDALSTACFVLGKAKALKLIEKYGAEGLLVDEDMNVYVTEGLKDCIKLQNEQYTIK